MSVYQSNPLEELQERIAAIEVELMHTRRLHQVALLNNDSGKTIDELQSRIIKLSDKYNTYKKAAARMR